jgi:hypothetical protein
MTTKTGTYPWSPVRNQSTWKGAQLIPIAIPPLYIDDALSLNNSRCGDHLNRIYPNELEVKDTTDTQKCASYLDFHFEIDNGGKLKTKHYDKHDDLTVLIVNFPFISSNIPASSAYVVYIQLLIRYSTAWTERNCWRKSYSSEATFVITIWLTVTKYPYLKWQWILYYLCRCFLSSITAETFTGLDCIYEQQGGCFIRSRNCLPFVSTWVHPRFAGRVRAAHLF